MKRLCIFYRDGERWKDKKVKWIVCQRCAARLKKGERMVRCGNMFNAIERRMDLYLRRKYDITLEERNQILKEQDYRCACCGRLFDGKTRMEVDHEHFKVLAERQLFHSWKAWVGERAPLFAYTKKRAIELAKRDALRSSVRGILCGGRYAGCNRKLGRIDNIPWMQKCLAYLQDPPARRVLK
jgi:hypothetical protein